MLQVDDAPTYAEGDPLAEADERLLERVRAEFLAVHGPKLKEFRRNPETAMEAGAKMVQVQILGTARDQNKFNTFAAVYSVPEVGPIIQVSVHRVIVIQINLTTRCPKACHLSYAKV